MALKAQLWRAKNYALSKALLLAAAGSFCVPLAVFAEEASVVNLVISEQTVVRPGKILQVLNSDPLRVEVTDEGDQLILLGKREGDATLLVWTETGQRIYAVRVTPPFRAPPPPASSFLATQRSPYTLGYTAQYMSSIGLRTDPPWQLRHTVAGADARDGSAFNANASADQFPGRYAFYEGSAHYSQKDLFVDAGDIFGLGSTLVPARRIRGANIALRQKTTGLVASAGQVRDPRSGGAYLSQSNPSALGANAEIITIGKVRLNTIGLYYANPADPASGGYDRTFLAQAVTWRPLPGFGSSTELAVSDAGLAHYQLLTIDTLGGALFADETGVSNAYLAPSQRAFETLRYGGQFQVMAGTQIGNETQRTISVEHTGSWNNTTSLDWRYAPASGVGVKHQVYKYDHAKSKQYQESMLIAHQIQNVTLHGATIYRYQRSERALVLEPSLFWYPNAYLSLQPGYQFNRAILRPQGKVASVSRVPYLASTLGDAATFKWNQILSLARRSTISRPQSTTFTFQEGLEWFPVPAHVLRGDLNVSQSDNSTLSGGFSVGYTYIWGVPSPNLLGNVWGHTVSGRVFKEFLIDGTMNDGDQPLAGVRVVSQDGRETLTGVKGEFSFSRVSRGPVRFWVDDNRLADAKFTTPNPQTVFVDDGTEKFLEFGISEGGIVIVRIVDSSQDLSRDITEGGIANLEVALLKGSKSLQKQVSRNDGSVIFQNVVPGNYSVRLISTTPVGYVEDVLASPVVVGTNGSVEANLRLRAQRGLAGLLFFDEKGDGNRNNGDKPAANVKIRLNGAETTTDENGRFLLADLKPGDWALEVESSLCRLEKPAVFHFNHVPRSITDIEIPCVPR